MQLRLIALTVLALTAILAGAVGYSQLSTAQALRSTLLPEHSAPAFHRVHTTASDEPREQRAAAAELMGRMGLADALRITPSARTSTYIVEGLETKPRIEFTSWDDARDQLTVVAGSLPVGSDPGAAITSTTSDDWDLAVGDELRVAGSQDEHRVPIVAVVEPASGGPPALTQDQAADAGSAPVLAIMSGQQLETVFPVRKLVWTLTADPERTAETDLGRLAVHLEELASAMIDDQAVDDSGVVDGGNLSAALRTAGQGTQAVRALLPTALIPLAAVGLVALLQLLALLSHSRRNETALMLARGVSGRQLARANMAEAGLAALIGAGLGWGVAVVGAPVLLSWLGGSSSAASPLILQMLTGSWAVPAVLLLLCVLGAGTFGLRAAHLDASRLHPARRTEKPVWRQSLLPLIILVLTVSGAGFSLWQLSASGSPLMDSTDADPQVNPLAAPAPALLIVSLALASVLIAVSVFRLLAATASHLRGYLLPSVFRSLARETGTLVLPVSLIVVSLAATLIAASYTSTFSSAARASGLLLNGAPVTVDVAGPQLLEAHGDLPDPSPYAALDDVTSVTPALHLPARFGQEHGTVQALGPDAVARALEPLPADDARQLAAALHADLPEPVVPLPESTRDVTVELAVGLGDPLPGPSSSATSRTVDAVVWITDGAGRLIPVESSTVTVGSASSWQQHQLRFELPGGIRAPSITALELRLGSATVYRDTRMELTGLLADGQRLDVPGPEDLELAPGTSEAGDEVAALRPGEHSPQSPDATEPLGFSLPPTPDGRAFVIRLTTTPDSDAAGIPAILSTTLLSQLGQQVGDAVTVDTGGNALELQVVGTAAVVPGAQEPLAVLVELPALQRAELHGQGSPHRPNQLLLGTDDPPGVAATAGSLLASGDAISTATDDTAAPFVAPVAVVLWLGAVGTLSLAGIALAVHVMTMGHRRRREVHLLHALGLPAAAQGRGRLLEMLFLGALATALGAGAGLLATGLTVGTMVRAVVLDAPAALAMPVVLPAALVAAALLVHLGLGAGAGWLAARSTRRQASSTTRVQVPR